MNHKVYQHHLLRLGQVEFYGEPSKIALIASGLPDRYFRFKSLTVSEDEAVIICVTTWEGEKPGDYEVVLPQGCGVNARISGVQDHRYELNRLTIEADMEWSSYDDGRYDTEPAVTNLTRET